MSGFLQVNLLDMISELGESQTQKIISQFSCPLNPDVERFLKKSAIPFAQQSITSTHLIFTSYKGELVLIAYYACANKILHVSRSSITKSLRKRISKFGMYNDDTKAYVIAAPLLAQFSKNFLNNYNKLISGDELMRIALENVEQAQLNIGGKVTYLECEDNIKLIEFYKSHGFVVFGRRTLTGAERTEMGEYLVQMLRIRK